MKLIKTNKDILYLLIIFIFSIILASRINDVDGINILNGLPNILGILFSGTLASLAIILALISSHELSMISTLENGYTKYTNFLDNAKTDITIVFICTALSIFLSISTKVKFPLSIISVVTEYLFVINFQLKIQFLVMLGIFILLLSLSAIFDLINSVFTLSNLRYEASQSKNENNK